MNHSRYHTHAPRLLDRPVKPGDDTEYEARLPLISRRALGGKGRVHDGAIARERRRPHDLVVPFDVERLGLLVDQNFEEVIEVLGIETRGRGGNAARHVEMTDDLDASNLGDFAGLRALHIAP